MGVGLCSHRRPSMAGDRSSWANRKGETLRKRLPVRPRLDRLAESGSRGSAYATVACQPAGTGDGPIRIAMSFAGGSDGHYQQHVGDERP